MQQLEEEERKVKVVEKSLLSIETKFEAKVIYKQFSFMCLRYLLHWLHLF